MELQQDPSSTVEFKHKDAKALYDKALHDRHSSKYREAIDGLEQVLDMEGDSGHLWEELAITQFLFWQSFVTTMHKIEIINMSIRPNHHQTSNDCLPYAARLQEAYNAFIIAMEYPVNKKNPKLLLHMAMLYLEFSAYRGALSVCTLLVEGYAHCSLVGEAIFLSAITAKALEKHQESAQYFQYLVEKPPHRLLAYQLYLLAAMELQRIPGMQEHAREVYAEAYRSMIALSPVTQSEKAAHVVYNTSRKNESHRVEIWYRDDSTWFDLAKRMISLNFPLLARSAFEIVRQRGGSFPLNLLVLDGVCQFRTGDKDSAVATLAVAMQADYYSELVRFLLGSWSEYWRAQFVKECSCVTRIQIWTRRCFYRNKWYLTVAGVLEVNRNNKALKIQCSWRVYVSCQALLNLRMIRREQEEAANEAMAHHDDYMIAKRLNAAAVKIQSLHKIFITKREQRIRRSIEETNNSIALAFANRRCTVRKLRYLIEWKHFTELEKKRRIYASIQIQQQIRVFLCRRRYKRLLLAKENQEKIVRMCLGKKAASLQLEIFREWKVFIGVLRSTTNLAATKIQRCYRACIARRRYRKELKRHHYATEVMHRMIWDRSQQMLRRVWCSLFSNALSNRIRKRKSAVLIQKRVRGMLTQKHVKKLRSRNRRINRVITAMQKKSVKQLLRQVFDSLFLNVNLNNEDRSHSALSIQRVFRGYRARRRVRLIVECERVLNSSDITLKGQSREYVLRICFLVLARLPGIADAERRAAGIRIRRWWRFIRNRQRLTMTLKKLAKRRAIAFRLQANFRSVASLFFSELKKIIQARKWRCNRAAKKIQRLIRNWLTYRRYLRAIDKKAAAKKIAYERKRHKRYLWLRLVLQAWRETIVQDRNQRLDAVRRIQRMYRSAVAKKKASKIVAKRAAQMRLLASMQLKPLERCFRFWEASLLEKSVLSIRSAANTPILSNEKRFYLSYYSSNQSEQSTIEQRAEVPSLLFYTVLNRVRKSGVCQLSFSGGGCSFNQVQMRQLFALASSILCDGEGANVPVSLNERIIDAMYNSNHCPVQKLILYNSTLDLASAAKLCHILKHPNFNIVSLVLGNTPLRTSAIITLAGALCYGNSKLEQLVLESCGIGSVGAAAIVEALCHNKRLWKLDMSANHITDSVCRVLSNALVMNGCLRVLCLSGNDLSDRGVLGFIAPALQAVASGSTSQLEQFVLRQNPRITVLGRMALQEAADARRSNSSTHHHATTTNNINIYTDDL